MAKAKEVPWIVTDATYEGRPDLNDRDHVRELIGDTNMDKPMVSDDTIALALTNQSSTLGAAAEVCRKIAAHFARETSSSKAGHSDSRDSLMRHYLDLAKELQERADTEVGKDAIAAPSAPMISQEAVDALEDDTDFRKPAFSLGMMIDPSFDPRRN